MNMTIYRFEHLFQQIKYFNMHSPEIIESRQAPIIINFF